MERPVVRLAGNWIMVFVEVDAPSYYDAVVLKDIPG
jgi:hypothetical protein